jgi:hypothetical protein
MNNANNNANNNAQAIDQLFKDHPYLIRGVIEEIKNVGAAGNPMNTSKMVEEMNKYKHIIEVAQDRVNFLKGQIEYIHSKSYGYGGGRKTKKRRSKE